ncbi:MAG: Ig-like domain-containing protein [Clostridia bacterium]|nr:Ig-like domain-containing protein [Clostridia bacterium]
MKNKFRRVLIKFLVVMFAVFTTISLGLVGTSCGKTEESTEEESATFSLNYHLKNLSLYETLQLEVEGFENVTWSSEPTGIVSVENGLVTANAYGTANVTATSGKNSDTCIINVLNEGKVPAIKTNVDDGGFNLLVNDTYQLDCSVSFNSQTFSDGTFSFVSSDGETVSVDANGLITAKKLGEAVITVTAEWRDFDSIYLVKEIPVSVHPDLSMNLSVEEDVIYTMASTIDGTTYSDRTKLSYKVILESKDVTSTANVNWVVSDPDIVTIDDLTVVARGRGTAVIYYEYVIDGRTYTSLPVKVTVSTPIKTVEDLVVYEIGTEDFIPASLFEGAAYALKIKAADYTQNADFAYGNIYIDVDTQNGFKGKEINFTVDTTLCSYSVDVLFVTHAISTADEFVAFLNSYSGNKSGVDANMTNTYYAVLTENIDLSGATLPSKSYNNDRFYGVFNGLGHSLTNVTVNSTGGIFGGLHLGTIENLAVIGVSITKTYSSYAILAGYLYPSAVVSNVYVKASINQLTFFRGLFYSGTNGKVSNVIAELEYGSVNTADNKFVFGVSSTGFSTPPTEVYAIGNATAYSGVDNGKEESDLSANYDPETQDVVYATIKDFYTAKKSAITAENGFSEYWKATDNAFWFGDNLLFVSEENVLKTINTYSYSDGSWSAAEAKVDLVELLGKTPEKLLVNGIETAIPTDGKYDVSSLTPGVEHKITVSAADGKLVVQPLRIISHEIGTADEFLAFIGSWNNSTQSVTKTYYAVLTANIDGSTATNAKNGMGQCVGQYQSSRFYGVFDGMGYTVSNITINNSCLFGALQNNVTTATIRNVAFVNLSGTNKSLLLGDSYSGVVENVYVQGSSVHSTHNGGVIAKTSNVYVNNCVFDVEYASTFTGTESYTVNGDSTAASTKFTNVYALGNAKQIQAGDETAPYAAGALAKAVAEGAIVLDATTGFNSCWRVVKEGDTTTVYFGNNVVDVYQAA